MKNKIEYIQGDLFANLPTDQPVMITHCVNNIGVIGGGFTGPLIRMFPQVEKRYLSKFRVNPCQGEGCVLSDRLKLLGQVQFIEKKNVTIANMCGQNGTIGPDNPKPVKYYALVRCMEKVQERIKASGYTTTVYGPKFCSVLAGGDWQFIEALIEEIWIADGIKVKIFYL